MKRIGISKRTGLACLAITLCLCMGVGTAFAYYTDTTKAQGTIPVTFENPGTHIEEEPDGLNKDITIVSDSDVPVLVRVKLYYAEHDASVTLVPETAGDWATVGDDGWIYYTKPLAAKGDMSSVLKASVVLGANANPEFDLVVEQQATKAYWNETEDSGSYAGKFLGVEIDMSGATPIPEDGLALKGLAMTPASVEGKEGE